MVADSTPEPDGSGRPARSPDAGKHERRPWRVEGTREPAGARPPGKQSWTSHRSPSIWLLLGLLLAVNWVLALSLPARTERVTVPYSSFREQVQAGNVAEVSSQESTIKGTFRRAIRYPDAKAAASVDFQTVRPAFADDRLLGLLLSRHTVINAKPPRSGESAFVTILVGFVPTILLLGGFFWLMRRAAGAAGGIGGLGRSKARRYESNAQRTTFADVAGIDEATEELSEVVDFLKHPDRYRRLGGMIPKGVLLTGPPGTGKTLLARAVAGEADVPFYSLSASEFVEMIVGVGASRVRDLFEQAKRDAPSIIFVDELDAIGRTRGAGALGGANDEREQTATATARHTCAAGSPARSPAARPSSWCSAKPPPAPSQTSSRRARSRARWPAAGACPSRSGPSPPFPATRTTRSRSARRSPSTRSS